MHEQSQQKTDSNLSIFCEKLLLACLGSYFIATPPNQIVHPHLAFKRACCSLAFPWVQFSTYVPLIFSFNFQVLVNISLWGLVVLIYNRNKHWKTLQILLARKVIRCGRPPKGTTFDNSIFDFVSSLHGHY